MMTLVRYGRHQLHMAKVLDRYGIGKKDKYDRGIWISEADLPAIKAGMQAQRNKIEGCGDIAVPGTNIHNWVYYHQYVDLFKEA